jgi:hypothetical protein
VTSALEFAIEAEPHDLMLQNQPPVDAGLDATRGGKMTHVFPYPVPDAPLGFFDCIGY